MSDITFNLAKDPWIPVRTIDGTAALVSIRDALVNAHQYRGLGLEFPTQQVAVFRLLLAALRRSVPSPWDDEAWATLWQAGRFDSSSIDAYFDEHAERFELFHSDTPFYQTPTLRTAKGEIKTPGVMVADFPTKAPYQTTRSEKSLSRLTCAEAAVWLVHTMAYDPSGIKSGAVGDPTVKGGKGYPIGVGVCGSLGHIIPLGQNLFETLMLNTITTDSHAIEFPADDVPAWERPVTTSARSDEGGATGPLDQYTFQSRRVRLTHDGEAVTGVVLCNGDKAVQQVFDGVETHSAWRFSEPQTKKYGRPVYMPRKPMAGRHMWRGLNQLVPTRGASSDKPAPVVAFLAHLREEEMLPPSYLVRLSRCSVEYGPQESTFADINDDSLALPLFSFQLDPEEEVAQGRVSAAQVGAIIDQVSAGVIAYANLVSTIHSCQGASPDAVAPQRQAAFEAGYARLDPTVRRWLAGLTADTTVADAQLHMYTAAKSVIRDLGRQYVDGLGPSVWRTGKPVESGDSGWANPGAQFQRFLFALHKAMPTTPRPSEQKGA